MARIIRAHMRGAAGSGGWGGMGRTLTAEDAVRGASALDHCCSGANGARLHGAARPSPTRGCQHPPSRIAATVYGLWSMVFRRSCVRFEGRTACCLEGEAGDQPDAEAQAPSSVYGLWPMV